MVAEQFEIRRIEWRQTLPLRQSVLRPGKPETASHFLGDSDPRNFHLGAFPLDKAGHCIGVASFHQEALQHQEPLFEPGSAMHPLEGDWYIQSVPYRLRGMAVDAGFRRRKIADRLLQAAEQELIRRGSGLLWFNARLLAIPFYQQAGYEILSDLFEITDVGPHKVMAKRL